MFGWVCCGVCLWLGCFDVNWLVLDCGRCWWRVEIVRDGIC